MGLLKRMLGLERAPDTEIPPRRSSATRGSADPDQEAVERYRYMLRTAPPEAVEQAHAEAFAALTPEQRRQVLTELSAVTPENERPTSDDPQTLARTATRAEVRRPGTLERSFSGPGGMGAGSMMAGTLLASVAGAFIGTAIASALLADFGADADAAGGAEASEAGTAESGAGDPGAGGDWGGGGGDFGGGDFGGGDVGGGF